MTKEERMYLTLQDIQEVELTCPHCRARVAWLIRQSLNIPDRCPNCTKDWFQMNDPRKRTLLLLAQAFRDTEEQFKEGVALRLLLAES